MRITLTTLFEFLKENPFGGDDFLTNNDFYEILTDEGYKNFSGIVKSGFPLRIYKIETNYGKVLEAARQVILFYSYCRRDVRTFEICESQIIKNVITNNTRDMEHLIRIELLLDRYECYNIIGIEDTDVFYCNDILVRCF